MSGFDETINGIDFSDVSFDLDEESTVEPEDSEFETQPEDEDVSDPSDGEEYEEESEEEEIEGAEPSDYEWDGQLDTLPPEVVVEGVRYDLRKTLKQVLAGNTKRSQEIAEERRQLAELRKFYEERMKEPEKPDPEPEYPNENMTAEQQREAFAKWQRWNARQEYVEMQKAGLAADPKALEQQQNIAAAQRRLAWLQGQEGWKDMEADAEQVVQNDPFWANAVRTDDGVEKFYEYLKSMRLAKKANELETERVKRKASARSKAGSKPSPAKKTAVDTFKEELKELKKLSPEERMERIVKSEFS